LSEGTHKYTVSVTWEPNTYTKMTRSKVVSFRGGEAVRVDLTVDDPGDRVRVIYVPTPAAVAAAMVDLAGVSNRDVVYEPGCGDARITIAAIRSGARRGICVDIDPERARESKANVESAGFANRIDVREGDALDVKNLADVSVVFLYMGDHFNMLVRPVLWRELKAGSRIVSHRFLMGDWPPDKTISMSTDEGVFELHLWTITEALKARRR
jgi:precorrin-6B methylase 2